MACIRVLLYLLVLIHALCQLISNLTQDNHFSLDWSLRFAEPAERWHVFGRREDSGRDRVHIARLPRQQCAWHRDRSHFITKSFFCFCHFLLNHWLRWLRCQSVMQLDCSTRIPTLWENRSQIVVDRVHSEAVLDPVCSRPGRVSLVLVLLKTILLGDSYSLRRGFARLFVLSRTRQHLLHRKTDYWEAWWLRKRTRCSVLERWVQLAAVERCFKLAFWWLKVLWSRTRFRVDVVDPPFTFIFRHRIRWWLPLNRV